MRLTEHAQLLTFKKRKEVEKVSFIAKLTSNDKVMDINLAQKTANNLAEIIERDLKVE